MSDKIESFLQAAKGGDMYAFAKLLSAIEQMGSAVLHYNALLLPDRAACRIGITGPPGSGKSTLIGGILKNLKKENFKIGVIAVDPTSPISQGAILGDRIRYADHGLRSNVFIRSLGTRGSLGGLSAVAYLMLRAFDSCGFDIVLIETVGVGQVEVEIMNVADHVTVVLVPESGDSIQAMKAGILEIADVFVVNKKDRPGAEALVREIEASLLLSNNEKKVNVLMTSALNGVGVDELTLQILSVEKKIDVKANRIQPKRLREEAKALMRSALEKKAEKIIENINGPNDLLKVLSFTN